MMMKTRLFLLALLALALFIPAHSQPQTTPSATEYMVAMRDNVKLATDVYLPEGKGPWPVVLLRTPYNKGLRGQATPWVAEGYAVVMQDCRGRFKSEGRYLPFMDDHYDGYDTVEWIAKQPWSNGKVGMYGGSALGITANQASIMTPPHLTAMYVIVAPASAYQHVIYTGGIFRREMNEGWLKSQGATDALKDMFSHNRHDGYFDIREGRLHWGKVKVPVYNQGGWYDVFQQGNIDNFVGLQHQGGDGARGKQRLIMGPWAHGQVEEVKYPANSAPPQREAQRWFAYWLKGVDNGIMREPAVRYYVMGDVTDPQAPGNEWRTTADWPPPSRMTSYYLAANGNLGERTPEAKDGQSSYLYDPKNPVPTIGGTNLTIKKGPMDQRAIGERKDVLKFMTAPLTAPLEVSGPVKVELWAESDAPDTDWMAKLVDVYPDGTERLVTDSGLRARFREGFDREVFMKKGQVYKFTIDLWSTSIVFNKGHRIAVHVTSSNDPRFDPNPNTGKPLRADGETRVANNTVYYNRQHASRILLPVAGLADQKTISAKP
jgi:predicted acyl esterase